MLRRLYPNPFLYFNPLPPHGGRPFTTQNNGHDTVFQSTPSAWRETYRYYALEVIFYISIHSLRMEGDPLLACRSFQCIPISIHSLRMEGDYFSARSVGIVKSFQSTPSAWRETHTAEQYDGQENAFQSTPSAWRETTQNMLRGVC